MKRRTFLFLIVPALMGISLSWAKPDKDQTAQAAKILAQYPQTEAFKLCVQPLPKTTPPGFYFYSVCFLKGRQNVGLVCHVSANGQMFTVRDVYNWALQDSNRSQLTPARMTALKKTLQKMPPNSAQLTLQNLLVVHFIEAGQPVTRIYDRSRLPPAIVKLYQTLSATEIAGSPIQTEREAPPAS